MFFEPPDPTTPLGRCLGLWHEFLEGDAAALTRVVADDAVLHSPVLFKPQHGKDLVVLYLTGASMTFVGDRSAAGSQTHTLPDGERWDGRFRYVRTIYGERDALLEFETVMDGKYVNGVDLITCDDQGRIVDFKVMVRPMQAMDAVRTMMLAALEELGGA